MKVRIGVGLGANALLPGELGPLVDTLDRLSFDSLWLSEVLTGSVLDPAQPCMATVNGWDAQVTVGVPLGSTNTSHDPLHPTAEVPGCS